MHELAATQSMVNTLLEECKTRKIQNLAQVDVELGVLTTYEADPFTYYYDLLKVKHEPLKDSKISISMVPGKLACKDCQAETLITSTLSIECPKCKGTNVQIIDGQDIKIKSIGVN